MTGRRFNQATRGIVRLASNGTCRTQLRQHHRTKHASHSLIAALWPAPLAILLLLSALCANAAEFHSAWPAGVQRTWIGPEYYACRLQDWRITNGRLECVEARAARPLRVAHLLTAAAKADAGTIELRVELGTIDPANEVSANHWAGFLIGAGDAQVDYRLTALVHHRPAEDGGLLALIDGTGRVVFRDNETSAQAGSYWAITGKLGENEAAELPATQHAGDGFGEFFPAAVELRLEATPTGDTYKLTLSAHNPATGELYSTATLENVASRLVDGGFGLVSHFGPAGSHRGHWFRDWRVSGTKVALHPERTFGPILCTQYTLSRGTLKLTAQMPPLGPNDAHSAELQIRPPGTDTWKAVARGTLDLDSYTIPFRVEQWDASRDVPFRVVYALNVGGAVAVEHEWCGTIRKDPVAKDEFVLGAFSCIKHYTGGLKWNSNGLWFPHAEFVQRVAAQNPDLLFFAGDQVYEGDITGAERQPDDSAMLDYLDKWYRWCWTFRELAKDRPCICIPDDHDVYHGNLWGAGGRHANRQDDGGYTMPARFVRMVERTQTSHLPDPFDPTPVEQGIGVYYTSLDYGGVSFAILEDRKFKSSPTVLVPEGKVANGWFQNPDFNPAPRADAPGAVLLGERQLKFLDAWAADWSHSAWMKVALSQTLFTNLATLPKTATSDNVVPSLKTPAPGEYIEDDKIVADADSDGWPQTGRNKAIRAIRKAFALHVCGDQHLASCVRYGVDDWDNAGYAQCTPAIGNTWPRRWFPPTPGAARQPDAPRYTGRFVDGFGNLMTVFAVANPVQSGHEPTNLHNRVPGHTIIRMRRDSRAITIECWPRWSDPSQPNAEQYPGWPIQIHQQDNYAREAFGWLPTLEIAGLSDPVVQVYDEKTGELVYALRIRGTSFQPRVFADGIYMVKVGEPDRDAWKALTGLRPQAQSETGRTRLEF